jgi:hypothetical protein
MKIREVIEIVGWEDGSGFSYTETIQDDVIELAALPTEGDFNWYETSKPIPGEDTKIVISYYAEEDDDCETPIARFETWASALWNEDQSHKYWDAIVNLMDDEKREAVHAELAPCTEIEFLERYIELDPDFEDVLESEFGIEL